MLLGNLLKSINKNYRKIPVKGISFDSRKIKKKDVLSIGFGNLEAKVVKVGFKKKSEKNSNQKFELNSC